MAPGRGPPRATPPTSRASNTPDRSSESSRTCACRLAALDSVDARRSPRSGGHRGARALRPENTLRAFEIAIARGLDMVELDVHLSRDGEVVVIHDAEVRYHDGRRVEVATLSAAELAAIDLGEGQGVPRLVDVFALARGRIAVYVELKGPRTGAALGALVRAGAADGVELISGSFLAALVAELRDAAPEVPRSVLFHRPPTSEMNRAGA